MSAQDRILAVLEQPQSVRMVVQSTGLANTHVRLWLAILLASGRITVRQVRPETDREFRRQFKVTRGRLPRLYQRIAAGERVDE